jgi:hypothetical protein
MIAAVINGQGFIYGVLVLIVIGLVFWVLMWAANYLELPEPINKIVRAVLVLGMVVLVINALLSLIGFQFIEW